MADEQALEDLRQRIEKLRKALRRILNADEEERIRHVHDIVRHALREDDRSAQS